MSQQRLRPNETTHNSLRYHLFHALKTHEISPIAVIFMPHRYTLLAKTTVTNTNLPLCFQTFHAIVARELNASQFQPGFFWDNDQFSYDAVCCQTDLLEFYANLIVEAVREGLVDDPDDWHGLKLMIHDLESPQVGASIPEFSSSSKDKPRHIEIEFVHSPLIDNGEMTRAEFYDRLEKLVARKLEELRPELNYTEEAESEAETTAESEVGSDAVNELETDAETDAGRDVESEARNETANEAGSEAENESESPAQETAPDEPDVTNSDTVCTTVQATEPESIDRQPLSRDQQFALNPLSFFVRPCEIKTPSDLDYEDFVQNSDLHRQRRHQLRAFRRAYRIAYRAWIESEDKNSVSFPIGTYKMAVIYNLPCNGTY